MFTTVTIWRWKIGEFPINLSREQQFNVQLLGPYIKRRRHEDAEEWANYVFEQEQKAKLEKEQNEFWV